VLWSPASTKVGLFATEMRLFPSRRGGVSRLSFRRDPVGSCWTDGPIHEREALPWADTFPIDSRMQRQAFCIAAGGGSARSRSARAQRDLVRLCPRQPVAFGDGRGKLTPVIEGAAPPCRRLPVNALSERFLLAAVGHHLVAQAWRGRCFAARGWGPTHWNFTLRSRGKVFLHRADRPRHAPAAGSSDLERIEIRPHG